MPAGVQITLPIIPEKNQKQKIKNLAIMKPNFSIIADNKDVTDLLQSRLLSLSISDEIGLVSDTLTIKLDNRDSVFEIPSCGANLQISLGYDSDIYSMGQFVVDEIELNAPPET